MPFIPRNRILDSVTNTYANLRNIAKNPQIHGFIIFVPGPTRKAWKKAY